MRRYCGQLRKIAESTRAHIFCTGDVVHVYDSCPELINMLIEELPHIYSAAGNHDLPNHLMSHIQRSAYWTLVQAGKITHLQAGKDYRPVGHPILVNGFSRGESPDKSPPKSNFLKLAVVHGYCWMKGTEHPGATLDSYVTCWADRLAGYDVAVIGDNHTGFLWPGPKITIFGNGTFVRRRADEIKLRPWVGLLTKDKTVQPLFLDTSEDQFADVPEDALKSVGLNADSFFELLQTLQDVQLNFEESAIRWMATNNVEQVIREAVLRAIRAKR